MQNKVVDPDSFLYTVQGNCWMCDKSIRYMRNSRKHQIKRYEKFGNPEVAQNFKNHEHHLIEFARQSASRQEDDKAAVALELQRAGYQTMKPGPGGL